MENKINGFSLLEMVIVGIVLSMLVITSIPMFHALERSKAMGIMSVVRDIRYDVVMCMMEGGQCNVFGHWVTIDGVKRWHGLPMTDPSNDSVAYSINIVDGDYTITAFKPDNPLNKITLTKSNCQGEGIFKGVC